MRRNLLRKTEEGTPVFKVFSLFLMAFLAFSGNVWAQTTITSLSQINQANGNYVIASDITGGTAGVSNFTGTLTGQAKTDGTFPVISGLTQPLFNTVTGATISNVMLKNVEILQDGPVGAIAGTATGASRIYNCGILPTPTVIDNNGYVVNYNGSYLGSNDDCCGGLVGILDGTARVINCFSFADIISGTDVAGIVGHNKYASLSDDIRTMVMNCMFYGDITSTTSTHISPVYGGQKITNVGPNKGLNNFDYFRYEASYSVERRITDYNCALGAEERFLKRFEFHRVLLNSNRELAGWYATGTANRTPMAKWVLDKTIAPCPILKVQNTYTSVVNYDPSRKVLGTLTVNIRMGNGGNVFSAPTGAAININQLELNVTDKDPDNFNNNYGKVQLPYYNQVGTKNYTGNRVVTGWKIVAITGGEKGEYKDEDVFGGRNFADREHWAKDFYGAGGTYRIFNQGAYWNVPDGVTAITIEPYWAKCVYLSDATYDVTYKADYGTSYGISAMGQRYTNGEYYSINGDNQKVYTTVPNARNALNSDANHTPYDYAIVLVGNIRCYFKGGANVQSVTGNVYNNDNAGAGKPYTFMSVDLDFDNEPDYVFCYQHGYIRNGVSPIRFDFIHITGLGMAQKVDGTDFLPEPGTFWNYGWFEVTNTALIKLTAIEYVTNKQVDAPLILQGGIYGQVYSYQGGEASGDLPHTPYIHIGSNAYFENFSNGSHLNNTQFTPHIPISVTGGEYEKLYLSGYTLPKNNNTPAHGADDAECYIDGGRFGEVAGAAMWQVDGNVGWSINHADMGSFFGGGINAVYPVTGNITTTIKNSHVDMFCGGPMFGDMSTNKTVTTVATDCTFGTFYGAGYGGNSYKRVSATENNNVTSTTFGGWSGWMSNHYKRKFSANNGISTHYDLIFFQYTGGQYLRNVAQIYVYYASFSLAKTRSVNSTLTRCIINNDFYGGGNLGKVEGNVVSTLNDCTVGGSAFGAGFSATIPTIDVYPTGDLYTSPYLDGEAGVFVKTIYPESVKYTWKHATTVSENHEFEDLPTGEHYILTTEDLTSLGTVAGNATLYLNGNTTVYNNVFGGGNESAVSGDTELLIKDHAKVFGNIYGGGNMGKVNGKTKVIVNGQRNN